MARTLTGFVVLAITTPNITCGDVNNPVSVVAECYQRPACRDTYSGPLKCCDVVVSWFDAVVVPGSLTPSRIRVSGTSQNCTSTQFVLSDPVIVKITLGPGAFAQSGPVPVGAFSGSFFVEIPIPASTLVQCDGKIAVAA
jgi:hypothetical protein